MRLIKRHISFILLRIFLSIQLIVGLLPVCAKANTWFELGTGLNRARGSDLEPHTDIGYQVLVAWGTHLSWMNYGDALYIYGSLDYDSLVQKGALELGSPTLTRQLMTPSLGLRYYRAVESAFRVWLGGGLGETFTQNKVEFVGLDQSNNYESSSGTINLEVGLQYRLTAGQLLGVSYNYFFLTSPESLSLAERGLQIGRQSTISAWQRFQLSWGFYL